MGKIIVLIMYILWICSIVTGLVVVFTDFKYEDLNIMALILFIFTLINTFFVLSKKNDGK